MKIKGMTFKPNRGDSYLATFENTVEGMESFEKVREVFRGFGNRVVRYGRGPRKKIYAELAKDPKNWESRHPWTPWQNNHYRPRLGVCTHFDVYTYPVRKKN